MHAGGGSLSKHCGLDGGRGGEALGPRIREGDDVGGISDNSDCHAPLLAASLLGMVLPAAFAAKARARGVAAPGAR
jgi:hypothetical protein